VCICIRCKGSTQRLKSTYGGGYVLEADVNPVVVVVVVVVVVAVAVVVVPLVVVTMCVCISDVKVLLSI